MKKKVFLPVLIASIVILAICSLSSANEDGIKRSNWIPNVGFLEFPVEQPLGDMWTFNCPYRGTVSATVDTKDDTDEAQSCVDPVLWLVDGKGNLLDIGDDEISCTYPQVCRYACPSVRAKCGECGKHSLIVRDYGPSGCDKGGGYELTVFVYDAAGNLLPEHAVRLGGRHRRASRAVMLGGGAYRKVPKWALNFGKAPEGPALDNENVPFFEFFLDDEEGVRAFDLDRYLTK